MLPVIILIFLNPSNRGRFHLPHLAHPVGFACGLGQASNSILFSYNEPSQGDQRLER